jgi:hypothetical protein
MGNIAFWSGLADLHLMFDVYIISRVVEKAIGV